MNKLSKEIDEDLDRVIALISEYENQSGYPFAQSVVLRKLDKEASRLEEKGFIGIRAPISDLIWNY